MGRSQTAVAASTATGTPARAEFPLGPSSGGGNTGNDSGHGGTRHGTIDQATTAGTSGSSSGGSAGPTVAGSSRSRTGRGGGAQPQTGVPSWIPRADVVDTDRPGLLRPVPGPASSVLRPAPSSVAGNAV